MSRALSDRPSPSLAPPGYGDWDGIRAEVRRSPQFRLNWFMMSRTPVDLQRRCDQLLKL